VIPEPESLEQRRYFHGRAASPCETFCYNVHLYDFEFFMLKHPLAPQNLALQSIHGLDIENLIWTHCGYKGSVN
jgi:hypothetical protein